MFQFLRTPLATGLLYALSTLTLTSSKPVPETSQKVVKTKVVYEYPPSSATNVGWIENIAVRANGELLLTSIGSPAQLHILDPNTPGAVPREIAGFTYRSTLGIVETCPDVFYILSTEFNTTSITSTPGTSAVWRVDFRNERLTGHLPVPEKIVTIAGANFVNGLTAFNDTLLFAADSGLGAVWAINVKTRRTWISAEDVLMKPLLGQGYLEGINGLHFRLSTKASCKDLFFTNSQQSIFGRMSFDQHAAPLGAATVVARPQQEMGLMSIDWDDFTYRKDGTAFVAGATGNTIQAVHPQGGQACIVAGGLNSTTIDRPTSMAFGRTTKDAHTLYAVTAGTAFSPTYVGGIKQSVGAQIVAVDLSGDEAWW